MNLKYSSLALSLIFIFSFSKSMADDVPAVLWNIKGNALNVKPVSALERDDHMFKDNMDDILNDDSKVLVFAMNQLSLEDFSSIENPVTTNSTLRSLQIFLDATPYMFLSSVQDPLSHLHDVHCGVREIVLDRNMDENVMQSISLAFEQSCVVILHITDAGVFGTIDPKMEDVKNVFLPSFINLPQNIIGVFTSAKTSWSGQSNDHHTLRNILQVQEDDPNFVNYTGCIYMYLENATVQVGKENSTILLTLPPETTGSSCDNGTSTLQLTFKSSGDVASVIVKFIFQNKMGSWITDASVTLSGAKLPAGELPAYSEMIEAPMGYSFNCGNLKLKTRNKTDVIVGMKGFQVQPFQIKDYKFSASFDCVPFFTVPIWMGVFVSLLFVIIINCGVYALFSVHTMDRFDDPKGKTISVAIGAE